MNFLADWLFYNSGNEASEKWHLWSGLAALSSIVSGKVWIDCGYFRILPNLYVVLLGASGDGKTTAMAMAKDFVREIGSVPFSAECQTKESLVKELDTYTRAHDLGPEAPPITYTPITIFVTELSQFIGVDPARMIDFLVTVYDSKFYDIKTKNKGSQTIVNPYVTLLGCTTPDWVTRYLRTDIITGGFSRRCVFVLATDEARRIPFPMVTPEQRAARDRMIVYANQLATVGGEFTWETEARAAYEEWYLTREITKDSNVIMFDKRAPIQVLKVAMLMALAKEPRLVLTLESLMAARAVLDEVLVKLPEVFCGVGRNELSMVAADVLAFLRLNGGFAPEKDVTKRMFGNAKPADIYSTLQHMQSTDQIRRYEDKRNGRIIIALPTAIPPSGASPPPGAAASPPSTQHPASTDPVAVPLTGQ